MKPILPEKIKILLMGDPPKNAPRVEKLLKDGGTHGFELRRVGEIGEALGSAGGSDFDVVLINLPRGAGRLINILDEIRTRAPDVPAIVLSDSKDKAMANRARKAGAEDYLVWGEINGRMLTHAILNVIERRRAEEEREYLATFPEEDPNPVIELDRMGNVFYTNPAAKTFFPDLPDLGIKHPGLKGVMSLIDRMLMEGRGLAVREVTVGDFTYEQKISLDYKRNYTRIFHTDVTDRKHVEKLIERQAYYDPLTDLPNRRLFMDRLDQVIARGLWHGHGSLVAVLFLNLDHFKRINDTLGHAAGDRLLRAVAGRLKESVREGDTVARMGGDEFAIILSHVAHIEDIPMVVDKVLAHFAQPFMSEDSEIFITASIGVSSYPADGGSAGKLLKNADAAMYRAKERGRNTIEYYLANMNVRSAERLTLENKLQHALEREEFVLNYQPLVDIGSGRIIGMEALLRWKHPELGMVSPGRFIPVAEESGLIVPIGEYVLRKACAENKAWQSAGHPPIVIAVNVSARQLQKKDFVQMVDQVLRETGMEAQYLELELTESIMQDAEASIRLVTELHEKGVRISIDDFGTGYSSLRYLKRLPITKLKIDISFVRNITTNESDAVITETIITMAQKLRLKAIAEGVETMEQLRFLQVLRCDEMQGYLYSRPLPAKEATELLANPKKLGP